MQMYATSSASILPTLHMHTNSAPLDDRGYAIASTAFSTTNETQHTLGTSNRDPPSLHRTDTHAVERKMHSRGLYATTLSGTPLYASLSLHGAHWAS